ncbi:MAG: 3'-5' exonuclease [Actinomycetaceae bacterium]|nr:3'-5' exonuclease [Arcanobacterium sp.]MDD7686383.1 3'-5' exonuclease [Actinomycetaceae bacterium]MDY5272663.1 3'-5' exonuclease [Arcanobacterium sp.]
MRSDYGTDPSSRRYAVVDVETTGLDPMSERVIEIGIIQLNAALEVESEWSTLVNPRRHVHASHIHGIVDADVAAAPTFAQIADTLTKLLEGRIFVAHNARFDQNFINREFARARLYHTIYTVNTVCTMNQSRIYCPPGSHSLIGLAQRLGLAEHQDHRGLSDARIAAELLRYYVECEKRGQRYACQAMSREGTAVHPAQWLTAAPWHATRSGRLP